MGARLVYEHCYPETQDTQLTTLQKILQCGSVGGGGSGGGGGTADCGCVIQGHGDPTGVVTPDDTAIPYTYTDLDSGILYTWNVETQAWI